MTRSETPSPLVTPLPACHHVLPILDHLAALGVLTSVVPSVAPGPAQLASPRNLLEMHVVRPCLRPTESETPGVGPSSLCFDKAPGDAEDCSS